MRKGTARAVRGVVSWQADQTCQIIGPDWDGKGLHFCIDGRKDPAPSAQRPCILRGMSSPAGALARAFVCVCLRVLELDARFEDARPTRRVIMTRWPRQEHIWSRGLGGEGQEDDIGDSFEVVRL